MAKLSIYIMSLLLLTSLFSCQNEELKNNGDMGYLMLDVATNASLNTKATEYDGKSIGLKILDAEGNLEKEYEDWQTIQGTKVALKPGSYQLIASSAGYDGQAGKKKPYYSGTKTINIVSGEIANTEIVCTLANVKVTVQFTESFKKAFGQDRSQRIEPNIMDIVNKEGGEGEYYFPVSNLIYNVMVYNISFGEALNYTDSVMDVNARDHIILNFGTKEDQTGKGDISVVVNEALQEFTYTILVPNTQTGSFTSLTTKPANPWTTFAKLSGTVDSSEETDPSKIVFKYHVSGETAEWQTIATTKSGEEFTADLEGLKPATTYEYAISDGTNHGDTIAFTTETRRTIPESGFENWWLKDEKIYMPGTLGGESFWDSGNTAAANMLGKDYNITLPDETEKHEGTTSAKLASKNVFVKFAAGNLFSGEFLGLDGMDGILSFGRPFESRPSQLKGWFKYTQGEINQDNNYPNKPEGAEKGQMDKGKIYIAIGDWEPQTFTVKNKSYTAIVPVQTNKNVQQLFDSNDEHIIAYGELVIDKTVADWEELAIDLTYRSDRKPKYIVIVGTSSIYGDYFVGSDQSVLWLDDLSLEYPTTYPTIK